MGNWIMKIPTEGAAKAKYLAAKKALEYVKPGMKLGLGTGSTAAFFVDLLGEKVAEGLEVLDQWHTQVADLFGEALADPKNLGFTHASVVAAEIERLRAVIRDLERTSGKLSRKSDYVNPWDDLPSYDR